MGYSSQDDNYSLYGAAQPYHAMNNRPHGCGAIFYVLGLLGFLLLTAPYAMHALGLIVHTSAWLVLAALVLFAFWAVRSLRRGLQRWRMDQQVRRERAMRSQPKPTSGPAVTGAGTAFPAGGMVTTVYGSGEVLRSAPEGQEKLPPT